MRTSLIAIQWHLLLIAMKDGRELEDEILRWEPDQVVGQMHILWLDFWIERIQYILIDFLMVKNRSYFRKAIEVWKHGFLVSNILDMLRSTSFKWAFTFTGLVIIQVLHTFSITFTKFSLIIRNITYILKILDFFGILEFSII